MKNIPLYQMSSFELRASCNLPCKFDGMQPFARKFVQIQSNLHVAVWLSQQGHPVAPFHMDHTRLAH